MGSWMDDLEDDVEEDNESSSHDDFGDKFQNMVESGEVNNINVMMIKDNIDDIDNVELLQTAKRRDDRKTAIKCYSDRLQELNAGVKEIEEEELDDELEELEEEMDQEDFSDDSKSTEDVDIDTDPGVVDEQDEEESEDVDLSEPTKNETSNEDPPEEKKSNKKSIMSEVDVSDIAPNAMTREQAEQKERKQGIMVWGDPGLGKTHFAYTMPEPVCIIDTEGKGNDIAHKFDKDVFIWQPSDYDGVIEALEESFKILAEYKSQADMLGTICVDSMSIMWDWAQQKYVEFAYPTKDDPSDVKFSSNMGQKGQSDWKQIKRYHNTKFRQRILDSPYHFCWTAMRGEDYAAVMDGETSVPPDKPVGEKNNEYKANYIIKIEEGPDGAPVGHLQKSALTKHNYINLKYPTFDKHKALLDAIDAVETGNSNDTIQDLEAEYGVRIVEGNPRGDSGE